ncbi:hypothetical protein LJC72_09115 [Bacteroides sp. OttesenSCG-928-D19]|nr:hypothetical protein [Bacteroides sp. OttesenSCG-928-D19]
MMKYIVLIVCVFYSLGLYSQEVGKESVNSFNKLAPAVSDFIKMKSEREKKKKKMDLSTDLARLKILDKNATLELENFIITNAATVNVIPEIPENNTAFCLAATREKLRNQGLILFIDGQCVGVGSTCKGFYSVSPIEEYEKGFHTLTLTTSDGVVKFTSIVDFSLRNIFMFNNKKNNIGLSN